MITMKSLQMLLAAAAVSLLTSAAAAQTFTVSGAFEYEDKGWSYNGWTGTDNMKPIRRADVHVINDATQAVLASGSTGQDGSFSLDVNSAGVLDIVVRVDCDTLQATGFQRIRVTTEGNAEYQSLSPVSAGHDTNLDLDIGTVSVLKITSGSNEASPFNLHDMAVHAWEYIMGTDIGEGMAPQTIRLYWPGGSGSYASGNDAHIATDDGYDDPVILHEIGHVVQNMYSDSDSPGGSHVFGDSNQDPKLSMGEGFGTAFGSAVMDQQMNRQAIYMDANGSSQSGGVQLRARIETTVPYSGDAYGAADELAVAATLFDLIDSAASPDQSTGSDDDDIGTGTTIGGLNRHKAWWDVFTGPVASASNLTLNHAWDGWFSEHGINGMQAELTDLFDNRRVRFYADADEPNNAQAAATSVGVNNSWRNNLTLYYSASNPPAPGTGDKDWYEFDAVIGSRIDVSTRYPNGVGDADTQCDTTLDLYTPGGGFVASDLGSGTGRNAFIDGYTITETGPWATRVRSGSSTRRYGRYDLRLSWEFKNELPEVTAGPSATPSTIDDSSTSVLSVTATDPNAGQVLSYSWTPLGGGTIVGSGASVSFDPPSVAVSTDFDVELMLSDDLGAEIGPLVVTITVTPGAPLCGTSASAVAGGSGKPGQAGTPVLGFNNLPVVPSTDFSLELSNALPLAPAFLIVGFSFLDAPFDQGNMYPSPDFILALNADGAGNLSVALPMSADPAFCGLGIWWQFMIPNDPGAGGPKQTSQSNYVMSLAGG
ncbi:MAG: hypothetical protein DRQ55_05245 [Planctomycetota bacterium]|nr:MAG: hypothetical protein DRQ55_05245 [Planctomycetota bacterium]